MKPIVSGLIGLVLCTSQNLWALDKDVQGVAEINYRTNCYDSRVRQAIDGAQRAAQIQAPVDCGAKASQITDFKILSNNCSPGEGGTVTVQATYHCEAPGVQFVASGAGGDEEMAEINVWPQVEKVCGSDPVKTTAVRVSPWDLVDLSVNHQGWYTASAKFECL